MKTSTTQCFSGSMPLQVPPQKVFGPYKPTPNWEPSAQVKLGTLGPPAPLSRSSRAFGRSSDPTGRTVAASGRHARHPFQHPTHRETHGKSWTESRNFRPSPAEGLIEGRSATSLPSKSTEKHTNNSFLWNTGLFLLWGILFKIRLILSE